MANPFYVAPPNILQALMAGTQGYQMGSGIRTQNQQSEARALAEQALLSGGDTRSALARLIGAGDVQGANAIANFGNQALDQQYKSGMLDIARQNVKPEAAKLAEAAGLKPGTPEFAKAVFPKTDTPISATDKKAIFSAEDDVPKLEATIRNVARAKELNPNVFTGYTASLRGSLGTSGIPGANKVIDRDASVATGEWDQVMGQEAIKMMSETLKGASTDFEMRKFIGIAADTTKPPEVRGRAMDRFLELANDELALRKRRASELRSGDYFKPGGGGSAAAGSVPKGAAAALKENPALRDQFEAKYGPGSAAKVLGQ